MGSDSSKVTWVSSQTKSHVHIRRRMIYVVSNGSNPRLAYLSSGNAKVKRHNFRTPAYQLGPIIRI